MKTLNTQVNEKITVDEKQAADGRGWTRMSRDLGEPNLSEENAQPRRHFRIRACEGSSVFNLLFPR